MGKHPPHAKDVGVDSSGENGRQTALGGHDGAEDEVEAHAVLAGVEVLRDKLAVAGVERKADVATVAQGQLQVLGAEISGTRFNLSVNSGQRFRNCKA